MNQDQYGWKVETTPEMVEDALGSGMLQDALGISSARGKHTFLYAEGVRKLQPRVAATLGKHRAKLPPTLKGFDIQGGHLTMAQSLAKTLDSPHLLHQKSISFSE